jgi:formate-dependent nitrite reductase membrane component NrfD
MIEHTPQKEWIEKQGLLVWLAFFFIELGAGTFLISSIFRCLLGMVLGWLICAVLGGGLHLLYLGHPLRSWRILVSSGWKSSWISRGLYFVVFFLVLGAIGLILNQWWGSSAFGLMIATDIFAFLTMIYGGLAMSYVHGIPLWNSGLLPVLFGMAGLWGGAGVTLLTMIGTGGTSRSGVEELAWIFLGSYVFLVIVYLMSATYRGTTGKFSVREIIAGRWASIFWLVVVGLGMALPLGVTITNLAVGFISIPPALLSTIIIFELIGDLSLRYCIWRSGFYSPLVSSLVAGSK